MSEMPQHAWVFPARLVRIEDADTQDYTCDMGMHDSRTERMRLLGINCPEVKGPTKVAGLIATDYARAWFAVAYGIDISQMPQRQTKITFTLPEWPFLIHTEKDPDNFGRYLALIWRICDGACLNDDLLSSGNAVVFVK